MLRALGLAAILSAGVFAAALLGLMMGYSRQPSGQETHQQTATENESEQSYREQTIPFWQKATTDPVAAFTLWLVIFTAVLGASSVFQLASLNRSEITSAQAANAAKLAANVADQDLKIGRRAFVFMIVEKAPVRDTTTKNVISWQFIPVWSNTGSTPTRNMTNHVSFKAFDGAIPDDWDFPDRWPDKTPIEKQINVPLLIGPNLSIGGQAIRIPVETLAAAVKGDKSLYIWGWALYNDVFPGTRVHITRFALKIGVSGDLSNPDLTSIGFPLHTKYNCADEECDAQGYPAGWRARQDASP